MQTKTEAGSKVFPANVERLLFDLDNPRFLDLADQKNALHAFCSDLHAKKTVLLAESIADVGLNPSELLIVIPAERARHYTVLEGNRRLAALKLLTNPTRLAESPLSKPFQARIRKAAEKIASNVSKPQCRLLPTREEANFWIALKHTGENDGVGVVQWDGEETHRFRGSSPVTQVLDYVRIHANLSAEARAGLSSRFPVTNLERLLGDPDVRKALGLTINGGEILFTHAASEVLKGLSRVVDDLARSIISVTDIKRKEHRADYLRKIHDDLPTGAPLTVPMHLTSRPGQPPHPASATAATRTSSPSRRTQLTRERSSVIKRTTIIEIDIPKINEVFNELRQLPVDKFPNAAAGLLRTLIDTTTQEYVSRMNLAITRNNLGQVDLKPRIEAAISDISTRTGNREMAKTAKNALMQPTGAIYIEKLHFHVHGRYEHPIPENLKLGWDMVELWILSMWSELKIQANANGNS